MALITDIGFCLWKTYKPVLEFFIPFKILGWGFKCAKLATNYLIDKIASWVFREDPSDLPRVPEDDDEEEVHMDDFFQPTMNHLEAIISQEMAAKCIQRCWRKSTMNKKTKAALTIQCWWRQQRAKRVLAQRKWATKKLQGFGLVFILKLRLKKYAHVSSVLQGFVKIIKAKNIRKQLKQQDKIKKTFLQVQDLSTEIFGDEGDDWATEEPLTFTNMFPSLPVEQVEDLERIAKQDRNRAWKKLKLSLSNRDPIVNPQRISIIHDSYKPLVIGFSKTATQQEIAEITRRNDEGYRTWIKDIVDNRMSGNIDIKTISMLKKIQIKTFDDIFPAHARRQQINALRRKRKLLELSWFPWQEKAIAQATLKRDRQIEAAEGRNDFGRGPN